MKTYCKGSNCKRRDTCAKHNITDESWYEYIDWSEYGGVHFWQDGEGNNHYETWTDCGDDGNYKLYEEVNQYGQNDQSGGW